MNPIVGIAVLGTLSLGAAIGVGIYKSLTAVNKQDDEIDKAMQEAKTKVTDVTTGALMKAAEALEKSAKTLREYVNKETTSFDDSFGCGFNDDFDGGFDADCENDFDFDAPEDWVEQDAEFVPSDEDAPPEYTEEAAMYADTQDEEPEPPEDVAESEADAEQSSEDFTFLDPDEEPAKGEGIGAQKK